MTSLRSSRQKQDATVKRQVYSLPEGAYFLTALYSEPSPSVDMGIELLENEHEKKKISSCL